MSIPCRKAFSATLLELARTDGDIIAVTSDARGSVTLTEFAKELPEQFVETGIAEQNAVAVAAGLARYGKRPFVASPAPFLSARSLEQVKIDVAYSRTNVKLIGVSGGVSYGPLGGSHHSLQDIAVMRAIQGLCVMLPCDARQTAWMTRELARYTGAVYLRMGRNPVPDVYGDGNAFTWGKANLLRTGNDVAIVATGEMVHKAVGAARLLAERGISARVLDMHTIKPMDCEAIYQAAKETRGIVTVEEHSVYGGLGGAVAEYCAQHCPAQMRILGLPDEALVSGTQEEIFAHYRLTPEGIAAETADLLKEGGSRE